MQRFISLLLALSLSACGIPFFAKPAPYEAHCDDSCFSQCAESIPYALWTDGTADGLRAVYIANGKIWQANDKQSALCETKRSACASCLTRLKSANVIR